MKRKIDKKIIKEILEIAKLMDEKGMVNTYEGNISVKKDNLIYITPSSKSKAKLTKKMIAVVDENGDQIYGEYKPSSEFPMHSHTYLMRDDINAIIHCHSPFLTAYAICNKKVITKCYPEMIMLLKDIPVAPYGKPGTNEIYSGVEPLIKDRNVILLANHGVLCVGPNLATVFNRLESAEAIAKVLTIAEKIGKPVELPEKELARLKK